MRESEDDDVQQGLSYPKDEGDNRLLGVTGRGDPIYYDTERHAEVTADPDSEETVQVESERELDADVTVGDIVQRIEEDIGWLNLTEFAEDHLPGQEEDES